MRVLVIDDDAPSVDALRVMLESAGHRVDCAGNGREGLSRLREANGYCVILLDIMMPVMNGYEFRATQKQDEQLAGIPVLVLTAGDRVDASSIDVAAIFHKPLKIPTLLEALARHC